MILLLAVSTASALFHSLQPCTPKTAASVAAAALSDGALAALPSPSGECVGIVLAAADAHGLEAMWEPEDWTDESVTFEPVCVSSSLWVRPLPLASPDEPLRSLPEVRLLEHAHAFLTTSAGQLHATTLNILELLVAHASELRAASSVLDFGCGSGILSLAALALGCHSGGAEDEPLPVMRAYGVDVHEAAMGAARRNALLNGCDDSRVVFGYGWELPSRLRADVSVANMMPGPLISVAPELKRHTREGGLLLISGFRDADVGALRAALEPAFEVPREPAVVREGRADEAGGRWLAFACRRRADEVETDDVGALSDSAV